MRSLRRRGRRVSSPTPNSHFEANILRSAAAILGRRAKRRRRFVLDVLLRLLRSIANDIDPGCPTGSCGAHIDGGMTS